MSKSLSLFYASKSSKFSVGTKVDLEVFRPVSVVPLFILIIFTRTYSTSLESNTNDLKLRLLIALHISKYDIKPS